MAYYLAVDLGTTGCRSILFDDSLHTVGSAYEEYGLITPKENWVEQDAELWWTLTLRTAKKAVASAHIPAKEIRGISISSQGITLVPVDERLNPLCNALSWLDVRAAEETESICKDYEADAFFALTGKRIKSAYTLPKLLWLKNHDTDVFDKAYKFLMPMDFLIARFTGEIVTDYSMASGTLLYDLKNGCWHKEICERYGIPVEKLPKLAWSGTPVGKVREEVAKELGLSQECIVAVGAQDQKCAAYGVGLCENAISVSLGTAAAITKTWTDLSAMKNSSISWCGYVQPSVWVTEGVIDTAGTCLRYVRDMFYKGESYEVINQEVAENIKRNEHLFFYPYLSANTELEKEMPQGCFYGVSLATERSSYARAVMEGVAFELRSILEKMHAYQENRGLILFGGGAKSEIWCQIIADVTDLRVATPVNAEAAGAGAARLAALACGKELPPLHIEKEYIPTEERKEYYEKKYKRYRLIAKKMWGSEGKDDLY